MIAAYAAGIGVTWNATNVGPVADSVSDYFGIALAAVGLFTTVLFIADFSSMTVIGRLTASRGARFVGLFSLGLCVVGNLLILIVDSVTLALILRFIIGIGVGLGFVGGTAYIQQMGGGSLAQGMYGGLSLAAGGLAVAVVPALEGSLGWQSPFVTAAVVGAVCFLAAAIGPATGSVADDGETGFVRLLGNRRLLRFAAVHSASFGLGIVLSNWVVTLLERRAGVGLELAGIIGALILFVGVIGRPGGGLYTHLWPKHTRAVLQGSLLIGGIGTLLIGFVPTTGLAVFGAVLVGLAAGIPFGPLVAGIGRTFPGSPGAAFGAMNFYALAVIIVGTPLMGVTFSLPWSGLIGFLAAALYWFVAIPITPGQSTFTPAVEEA